MTIFLERLAVVLLLVWLGLSAWAALTRRPAMLATLFLVGLGLGAFGRQFMGTIWWPAKVTTYVSLLYVTLLDLRWVPDVKRGPGLVWWGLIGTVWLSVMAAVVIGTGDVRMLGGSLLQSPLARPLAQGISYAAGLSLLPLGILAAKERSQDVIVSGYFWAVVVVTATGIVQMVITASGGSFLPILRPGMRHVSELAAFSVGGTVVRRIYSIAGEPKSLAVFLLPALFGQMLVLVGQGQSQRPWWAHPALMVAVGGVFLLTFSTAGLIAFVAGIAIFSFVLVPGMGRSPLRPALMGGATLAGAALAFFAVAGGGGTQGRDVEFAQTLEARTVQRLRKVADERPETRALRYVWEERPGAMALGLGPGMYNFHVVGLVHSQGVEPIDSGWTVALLDLGLLGLSLLAVWLAWMLGRSVMLLRRGLKSTAGLTTLAVGGLVAGGVMHLGTAALDVAMLSGGLVLGIAHAGAPAGRDVAEGLTGPPAGGRADRALGR